MAGQADPNAPVLAAPSRESGGGRQSWPIQRPARAWLGAAALAAVLLALALLAQRWLVLPISPAAVFVVLAAAMLGLAAAGLALRLLSSLTLHYVLEDNTLTIVRGMARWVIPLAAIEHAYVGETRAVVLDRDALPGFQLGREIVRDGGKALFFSTVPAAVATVVQTGDCFYILSPQRADDFVHALEQRRLQAGPAQAAEPGPGPLVMLRRPLAIALAALAVLGNAALGAYIAWWYPTLPSLPVHFTAAGLPDRWAAPAALLRLPQIGLQVLAANLLLSFLPVLRRPIITYILLGSAVLVQVLLWVAFQSLLP